MVPDPTEEEFTRRWRELAESLERDRPGQSLPFEDDLDSGLDPDLAASAELAEFEDLPDLPDLTELADLTGLADLDDELVSGESGPLGPRDWEPVGLEADDDEHYEPPEPPPVLGGEPLLVVSWVGVVVGLLTVLVWAIFRPHVDILLARVGGVAFVAGLGVLIWRMPHRRGADDSGAQV